MRSKPNRYSATLPGPNPAYDARRTVVGTAIVAAALLTAVVATAYPVAAAGIVVGAVAARRVVRAAVHLRMERRRKGRSRRVCIPKTGVCVEA